MARTGRDLLLSHLHETCRWHPRRAVTVRRDFPANCEKEGEPTSGLEPLTCSLRVIGQALQGCAQPCKSPIPKRRSLLGVVRVAPYCAPGGVRVVSGGDGLSLFQHT